MPLTIRDDKSSVATTRRHDEGCGDDDDDDGRALTTPYSHSRCSQQPTATILHIFA